jgi:hypothetical protein
MNAYLIGFDCFAEEAICSLGVADWHGREAVRNNLRRFIDKGFTALQQGQAPDRIGRPGRVLGRTCRAG